MELRQRLWKCHLELGEADVLFLSEFYSIVKLWLSPRHLQSSLACAEDMLRLKPDSCQVFTFYSFFCFQISCILHALVYLPFAKHKLYCVTRLTWSVEVGIQVKCICCEGVSLFGSSLRGVEKRWPCSQLLPARTCGPGMLDLAQICCCTSHLRACLFAMHHIGAYAAFCLLYVSPP